MNAIHSLAKAQQLLSQGAISVTSQARSFLSEIDNHQHLNAFIEVFDDVVEQAERIDQKIANGTQGKLAGLIVGVKDLISIEGQKINAASQILEGYTSSYSSTAIERMLQEDALIIGRNNCDEFGMGSTNESSFFGPTRNPINTDRVPGGSSGGSAAAVKAGTCMVSLGTDTGGSVRQPAAFCDVIGFKPTYGRISRYGMLAYASSFDSMGIIGRTIGDIRSVLDIIAGYDGRDATSSKKPVQKAVDSGKRKILVFNETINHDQLAPAIKDATLEKIAQFEKDGHEVISEDFPLLEYVLPTYYILASAEASSNLSRYDGVRYGRRADAFDDLDSMYVHSRTEGFGEEVQRRIMLGTFVLSASYHDAFFTQAQKVRRVLRDALADCFERADFIALPTSPTPPFKIGEVDKDPLQMYLSDLYTVLASVTGNPAISIPNGYDGSGLPIGFQLIGEKFNETNLLAFADYALSLGREGVKK